MGEFISPIFSVPKKDNQVCLIVNLKLLNEHVRYMHFKMDSIDTAMKLVTKDCWMASIDLKDAYYTVMIYEKFQKYLKFCYNDRLYKYRAHPNSLPSCPRPFTNITNCISKLLAIPRPSIRQVVQVIGYLVSSFPAVKYGKSHYRAIENDKIVSLKFANGNFDSKMTLSLEAKQQLQWWLKHLFISIDDTEIPPVNVASKSDASLSGWGAVLGDSFTGGQWHQNETGHHVNYLELLAAYFALKSFSNSITNKHVKVLRVYRGKLGKI